MLDFGSIVLREEPVVGPDGKHYTLREANGRTATEHRNSIIASSQFGPDGKITGIKDLAAVEAKFVVNCMWDEQGRNPPLAVIEGWPARVKKLLYDKAKELSDFGEDSIAKASLEKALSRDDSPVHLSTLRAWAATLEGSEYASFKSLLEEPEQSPKNS
jgi:hypothetical protein